MARRETLDDLLRDPIEASRLTAWCEGYRIDPRTVHRLRRGEHTPRRSTILMLSVVLGVPEERVRRAIEASRAAAEC